MKTAIAVLTTATVTAAPEVTSNIAAVSLTSATTNYCGLQATITNSANLQNLNNRLYIRYAFAMTDNSSTISRLSPLGSFEVHIPREASAVRITTTKEKITIQGLYLHVWVDHEELAAAATLGLSVII